MEILSEENSQSTLNFFVGVTGKSPNENKPELTRLRGLQKNKEDAAREAMAFVERNNTSLIQVYSNEVKPVPSKDSDKVIPVTQGEGRIAASSGCLFSTHGAGPCLILMRYDPDTGASALAHIDNRTSESIDRFIGKFYGADPDKNNVEISIVSGHENIFQKVFSVLKSRGLDKNIKHLSVDLDGSRSDAVVFYNGEIYPYSYSNQTDDPDYIYGIPKNDHYHKNVADLQKATDLVKFQAQPGMPLDIIDV